MDISEINRAITELEHGATNYQSVGRLASLYTVRAHLMPTDDGIAVASVIEPESDSELMRVISGKDINKVMEVFEEHLNGLQLVYPKEYKVIMDRLASL